MPMQPGSPQAKIPPGEDALIRMIQELQRVVREDRAGAARAVAPWSARTDDGGIAAGTKIIAGDLGGSRVELDSAGLRKYAADGTTVQVDLTGDVAAFSGLITGSEIIGGEIKTAASGKRIVVTPESQPGVESSEIQFYTGHPAEAFPASIYVSTFEQGTYSSGTLGVGSPTYDAAPGAARTGAYLNLMSEYPGDTGEGSRSQVWLGARNIVLNPTALLDGQVWDDEAGRLDIETDHKTVLSANADEYVAFSSDSWLTRRVIVVNDDTHKALLVSRYQIVIGIRHDNYVKTISAAKPLFVWQVDAAAGQQLQYTTDGTAWTVSGGPAASMVRYTPTSGADTSGSVGDVACDDDFLYTKTSTGWKRAAVATW